MFPIKTMCSVGKSILRKGSPGEVQTVVFYSAVARLRLMAQKVGVSNHTSRNQKEDAKQEFGGTNSAESLQAAVQPDQVKVPGNRLTQ
jgi:hypothetical protein